MLTVLAMPAPPAAAASPLCKWATSRTPRVCVTLSPNGTVPMRGGEGELPGRSLTIDVVGPFFSSRSNRLLSISATGPGAIALDGMTWPTRVGNNHFRAEAAFMTGPGLVGARVVEVWLKSGSRSFRITLSVRF